MAAAATAWGVSLGDETIVAKDKVIQTTNQRRKAASHEPQREGVERESCPEAGRTTSSASDILISINWSLSSSGS